MSGKDWMDSLRFKDSNILDYYYSLFYFYKFSSTSIDSSISDFTIELSSILSTPLFYSSIVTFSNSIIILLSSNLDPNSSITPLSSALTYSNTGLLTCSPILSATLCNSSFSTFCIINRIFSLCYSVISSSSSEDDDNG